jgi:hypothetical protein
LPSPLRWSPYLDQVIQDDDSAAGIASKIGVNPATNMVSYPILAKNNVIPSRPDKIGVEAKGRTANIVHNKANKLKHRRANRKHLQLPFQKCNYPLCENDIEMDL